VQSSQGIEKDIFAWRAIKLIFSSFCQKLCLDHSVKKIKFGTCNLIVYQLKASLFFKIMTFFFHAATKRQIPVCLLLHASHVAHHGHKKILIRTVDMNVMALSVYVAQSLGPECELWMAFGTGKHFRYSVAHSMATALGPEKAKSFSMFHYCVLI